MITNHIDNKIKKGEWIAIYPFGYVRTIQPDGSIEVTIDKRQAEIVRLIFNLYTSEQYSFSMIAKEVKSRYQEPIYKAKIENIIKKPFYYGMMKIKNQLYPHHYGAIITKEVFDKAQQIASSRRGRWVPPTQST